MQGRQLIGAFASGLVLAGTLVAQGTPARTAPKGFEETPAALRACDELRSVADKERSCTDPVEGKQLLDQLAKGLRHDEWYVRVRCIELLTKAQDAATAHEHLIAGAGCIKEDFEARRREVIRRNPTNTPFPDKPAKSFGPDYDEYIRKQLEWLNRTFTALEKHRRVADDLNLLVEEYRRGLAAIPEAPRRCGLLALVRQTGSIPELLGTLLEVADEAVIAALGDVHAATEALVREADKDLKAVRAKLKPRPKPGHIHDKDAWAAQERQRIEVGTRWEVAAVAKCNGKLADFVDQVARFAFSQSLPPSPPEGSSNSAWRSWCASARKAFAERAAK